MSGTRSRLPRARGSGRLVPERVWQLDSLDEVELGMLDLRLDTSCSERGDGMNQKWWEHEPLNSLDLSQNSLATLSPKIKHLAALTTLHLQNNSLVNLPAEIGQLTKLIKLNLSHNRLESFPEGLYKLTELRQLNVSHNKVSSIKEDVGDLIMLEKLDVSHNSLTLLPPGVGFLTRLTQLMAHHNSIIDVPPDVGNLRGQDYDFPVTTVLRELDLSNNEVSVLPPLGELRKLEMFRADHNMLTQVPDLRGCLCVREMHVGGNCIEEIAPELVEDLANLRVFNLRDNKLEEIPEEMTNLRNLIRLDLGNNGIKELPARLSLLPHLSSLQLEGNPLRTVRSDVIRAGTSRVLRVLRGQLTEGEGLSNSPRTSSAMPGQIPNTWPTKYSMRSNRALSLGMRNLTLIPEEPFTEALAAEVQTVDLCKNALISIPEGLLLLAGFITELVISQNKLTSVPGSLAKCRHLQYIDLSQNCLSDLPKELNSLERLREINIAQNKYQALPNCLYGMPGLEILMARDNKIAAVDANALLTIPRLAVLDLANNDIQVVPPELGLLRLSCLELTGNAFRVPRQALLEKGTASVLSYLRDRLPKDNY
ncbi:hypothetical protein B566_EDAN012597 [Ephemera danica]|nr:hypothetical protein B566_EDAN012597 [Ephemera danica]